MFDKLQFVVVSVLMSGFVAERFLYFMDDRYGVSTFTWLFITYLFMLFPFIIHEFAKIQPRCRNKPFYKNMIQAMRNAAWTVGTVDVFSFASGFIPVVGTILSIVGFFPLIGTPAIWLANYAIYKILSKLFNFVKKKNYCKDTDNKYALMAVGASIGLAVIYEYLPF